MSWEVLEVCTSWEFLEYKEKYLGITLREGFLEMR